jgi:hypothetical protein
MMAMTMVGVSRDCSGGDDDLFGVAVSVFLGGREETHFVLFCFVFLRLGIRGVVVRVRLCSMVS